MKTPPPTAKTILCVDDEIYILHTLERLLRRLNHHVITTTDPYEALRLLDTQPVHLIISDYRMPGMSGTQFLQQAKIKCPHAVRVILSGYGELHAIIEAINQGEAYRFIMKPWEVDPLLETIRLCLENDDQEVPVPWETAS